MPDAFLQGWRVLIVEDDFFLADDLRAAFEQQGATVIGPVGRVGHALAILSREQVDGAVLDINLGGELVYPVADALRARHVPFVFATGYDPRKHPVPVSGRHALPEAGRLVGSCMVAVRHKGRVLTRVVHARLRRRTKGQERSV